MGTDHHHKLPNTKYNQKRFPLFLQSPLNDGFCCREDHEECAEHPELNITEQEAEVFEEFLETLVDAGIAKGRQGRK